MIRISPVTLANTKSDAALGGAPGSKQPAQTKTNNQHTELDKAMPVRGTPPHDDHRTLPVWPPRAPRTARSPYLSESPPGAPPRHESNPNLLKPHAPAQPHSVASLARLASLYA